MGPSLDLKIAQMDANTADNASSIDDTNIGSNNILQNILSNQQYTQAMVEQNTADYVSNASTYLAMPTYDGSGQATHPKVLYFKNGWNGYRFWMSYTPYPFENSSYENPCLAVSNDGVTWITPPGVTNPIEPKPIATNDYNSDSHIVMVGSNMELWWRAIIGVTAVIKRKISSDGINWSPTETMFTLGVGDILSPALIYENGIYKIWYVNSNNSVYTIIYQESIDGKVWTNTKTLNILFTGGNHAWHLDCIKTNGKIELLIFVEPINALYYCSSYDNINFTIPIEIMVGRYSTTYFDNGSLYRSSLVVVDGQYYCYYCGITKTTMANWLALTIGDSPLTLGIVSNNSVPAKIYRQTANNIFNITDTIDKFPKHAITKTNITTTFASPNGFPESVGGQLTTDNTYPEWGRQRQTYELYNNTKVYMRMTSIVDGSWTPFVLLPTNISYTINTVLLADDITTYPKDAVSYNTITTVYASANGFPEAQGGTLKTTNIKTSEKGWQEQTYTTYVSKNKYIRYVNSDGSWTTFKMIFFPLHGITSARPINGRFTGMEYFDDTLQKPIWFNGVIWVDKDGFVPKIKRGNTTTRQAIVTTDLTIGEDYFDTTLFKPLWVKSISPTVWVDAMGTVTA